MNFRRFSVLSFACGLLLASCGDNEKPVSSPAIVLGDPNTIVTEHDSTNLKDFVADLKPQIDVVPADTPAVVQPGQKKDSIKVTVQQKQVPDQEPTGAGLTIPFSEASVFIGGINTKPANRNQNPAKANGVTYLLVSGVINGAKMKVSNGTVTKVSQRYQTIVKAVDGNETLFLESITNTTDWAPLTGKNNIYTISGLAPGSLEADDITASSLRNAVSKAARRQRMSRSDEQDWQQLVKNARNANRKPLGVVLRSVMWKIDGKANGKPFSKQIRIDLPLQ